MTRPSFHVGPTPEEQEYLKRIPVLPIFQKLPLTGDGCFDAAIRVVFHHEGYWSNDPDDPGGPTAWGWSLRAAQKIGDLDGDGFLEFDIDHDGDVDAADLKHLTAEQAVDLYKKVYWDGYAYNRLPLSIGIKAFDLAVVMGAVQAGKILQRSVRACSDHRLVEDGIIGPFSIDAMKDCNELALMAATRAHAAGFFNLLAGVRPKSRKYLNGWLNRAYF